MHIYSLSHARMSTIMEEKKKKRNKSNSGEINK